jgi:hypothetical protein
MDIHREDGKERDKREAKGERKEIIVIRQRKGRTERTDRRERRERDTVRFGSIKEVGQTDRQTFEERTIERATVKRFFIPLFI